jgi:hypothetical protein
MTLSSTGYLDDAYLSVNPYLNAFVDGPRSMQVDMQTDGTSPQGMQADMALEDQETEPGFQVNMNIQDLSPIGMQVESLKIDRIGMQVNPVIYNVTQLRILCSFTSRGIAKRYGAGPIDLDDANWESPQSYETGDLGKLSNLNTDVTDERIQSADGVKSIELRCDTGQSNTFVDTLGILDHNITTSATITVEASDVSDFSTIKFSFTVNPTMPYAIYIAPELPTVPARYYRIFITDVTNADNHIKVGTIVFGSASIFLPNECYVNPVGFGQVHFKDEIETEAFTNTSNDRATRRFLSLSFVKLDVEAGNYDKLQDYFREAKTDLKCLIIPTPTKPTVLTVFSKLVQLPQENHDAIDVRTDELNAHYASLDLDWDESR